MRKTEELTRHKLACSDQNCAVPGNQRDSYNSSLRRLRVHERRRDIKGDFKASGSVAVREFRLEGEGFVAKRVR